MHTEASSTSTTKDKQRNNSATAQKAKREPRRAKGRTRHLGCPSRRGSLAGVHGKQRLAQDPRRGPQGFPGPIHTTLRSHWASLGEPRTPTTKQSNSTGREATQSSGCRDREAVSVLLAECSADPKH